VGFAERMAEEIKLVVGLGNPGAQYRGTRHNVGFEVIDTLAKRHGISIRRRKGPAMIGEGLIVGAEVMLAKPLTFMNLSGEAVLYIAEWQRLESGQILIVYDDMALDLGRLRIRAGGSDGGHKGMKSIIAMLGTQHFPRLRIGIGSAERDAVKHVLSRFRRDEKPVIDEAISRAADAVECVIKNGVEAAMAEYNRANER
jgi:PTH1 family peptidyl-tRNA hydrolase